MLHNKIENGISAAETWAVGLVAAVIANLCACMCVKWCDCSSKVDSGHKWSVRCIQCTVGFWNCGFLLLLCCSTSDWIGQEKDSCFVWSRSLVCATYLHGAYGSQCSSWSWLMLAKAGSDDAVWCSEICLDCILFCSGILKDLIVGTSENVGPSVFINLLCPLVLFLWLWLGKRGARANCRAQSRAALLLGLPYQAALRRLHQFCASKRLLGTWEERFFRNPECMYIGISHGAVVEAHVTLHVLVIAVTKIAWPGMCSYVCLLFTFCLLNPSAAVINV